MTRSAPRPSACWPPPLTAGPAIGRPARAAEPSYPFEGTWVRANRVCAANAPRVRTYTAQDVTFPTGHCTFRKVAKGGGQFEIFEECRRAERPGNYTETIRMLGPDLMQMRRQAARLKIARPLRYTRCTVAAPARAPGTRRGTQPAAARRSPGTAPGRRRRPRGRPRTMPPSRRPGARTRGLTPRFAIDAPETVLYLFRHGRGYPQRYPASSEPGERRC